MLGKRFANRLRAIRKFLGLTQEQVEEKAGISQSQLSGMERGKRGFTFKSLETICQVYNIHPADLFLGEDYPPLVISRQSVADILKVISQLSDYEIGQLAAQAQIMLKKKQEEDGAG